MVKQKISAHKIAETRRMEKAMVGKTIVEVFYDDKNDYNQHIEGVYGLKLFDGTVVTFSSSGDDATRTGMDIIPNNIRSITACELIASI